MRLTGQASRARNPAPARILARRRFWLACLLVGLAGLLSACGASAGEPTPTPLPTSNLPGLVTVEPHMCAVTRLAMLRTDEPQGHMLAWAPDSARLAYLAPSSSSTWMVGTLMLVNAPDFAAPQELDDHVAGHLSWSPDGTALAFLSLRRSDSLYTVNVVYPESGESIDLFPGEAARSDAWSSPKAVTGWDSQRWLRVQVSCGLDCLQSYRVSMPDGSLTALGEPAQRNWDWWNYQLNPGPALPEEYLEFAREVNWSPDGERLVYINPQRDAWVIDMDSQTQYPLPTGGYLNASETDWSADGKYLAMQAEDWLFIFADCP